MNDRFIQGKLEKEFDYKHCNRTDIGWCIDYVDKLCPRTCNYAKKIENLSIQIIQNERRSKYV
jgi:hypothetical protein